LICSSVQIIMRHPLCRNTNVSSKIISPQGGPLSSQIDVCKCSQPRRRCNILQYTQVWSRLVLYLVFHWYQALGCPWIFILKVSFSEKATKLRKKFPLVLTLPSKNNCFVKTSGRFFPILWHSHNVLTLQHHLGNRIDPKTRVFIIPK
jgi:hypothetical protein